MRYLVYAVTTLALGLGLGPASATPQATPDSRYLRAGAISGLADPLVDSATYDWGLFVINADPDFYLSGPVVLMLSVNGDSPSALTEAISPAGPVAPGDSFWLPVSQYSFDPARFQGGGITHDIIVWPVRLGSVTLDSAVAVRHFAHTPALTANHLSIRSINLPTQLQEGQSYALTLDLRNEDPAHALYHPVDIYLSVDGDAPSVLASEVYPPQAVAPGETFQVTVPGYVFDGARFQGGGITHDIIVWPMSIHVDQGDSLVKPVRWQAREGRLPSGQAGALLYEREAPALQPAGVYPNPFSGHSPVWPVWLEQPATVRLEIIHPGDGRILTQQSHQLPAGTHLLRADLTKLAPGIYSYRLISPAGVTQGTIQKQTP